VHDGGSVNRTCKSCGDKVLLLVAAITRGVCLLCAAKIRHSSSADCLSADAEQWSEESKRSRDYNYTKGVERLSYRSEHYWCNSCGRPVVFTAAQQKYAYEVEKRYIYQTRKLCEPCYEARSK